MNYLRYLRPQKNLKFARIAHYRSFGDASRPFPPPNPTRPVEEAPSVDDNKPKEVLSSTSSSSSSSSSKDTVMSTTLDAIAEQTIYQPKETELRRSHHFDTYNLLTQLENQGFTRKQAEVIMKGIKFRLRECTASVRQQLLLTSDLENESYLFKAALSELRTEVQVMRRNDMQMLQNELSLITREVDALEQRLNEDVANMKNDIQLDMNNRKNETREDQKVMDMKIQEINNKFTIRLGDIRTEIEAVRWETIWKGMTGVVLAGLTIASLGYLLKKYSARKAARMRMEEDKKRKQLKEDASRAGTADMEVIF